MSNSNGNPYGIGYYQSKKQMAEKEKEKSATNELLSDISEELKNISKALSDVLDRIDKEQ